VKVAFGSGYHRPKIIVINKLMGEWDSILGRKLKAEWENFVCILFFSGK